MLYPLVIITTTQGSSTNHLCCQFVCDAMQSRSISSSVGEGYFVLPAYRCDHE